MKTLYKAIYFAALISCINFSTRAVAGPKKSNREQQKKVETSLSEHGKQHIVKDNNLLTMPNKTNRELGGNYVYDLNKSNKNYTAMNQELAEDVLNNKIPVKEITRDARGETFKMKKPFTGYRVTGFNYGSNTQKKKAEELLNRYDGNIFVDPESVRPKKRYQLMEAKKLFSAVQPELEKREFNQVRVVKGEDGKIKTMYPMNDTENNPSDQE